MASDPETAHDALRQAFQDRDWERFEAILNGGDLDARGLGAALYYLAGSERTALLARALELGADADWASSPRPLQLAAKAGRAEHVELLLDHGADPGAGTSIATPLFDAIDAGEDVCATILVRAGAPLEVEGAAIPPLVYAAFRGLAGTVRAMVERGADLEVRATFDGRLFLMGAAVRNLKGKAKLDAIRAFGYQAGQGGPATHVHDRATALIAAAAQGFSEVIEILADAGADLGASDAGGFTAARVADLAGHHELSAWIRARGGSLEAAAEAPDAAVGEPAPALEAPPQAVIELCARLRRETRADDSVSPAAGLATLAPADAARFERSRVLARLRRAASGKRFGEIVATLGERCGSTPRDRRDEIGGYSCHVRSDRELDIDALPAALGIESDAFLFVSRGLERAEEVTVLATGEPLEAVAAVATDGANYDIGTEHILAWLQALGSRWPWRLWAIRHDLLGLALADPGDELEALVRSLCRICPDLLEQDGDRGVALVDRLRRTGRVVLWWD